MRVPLTPDIDDPPPPPYTPHGLISPAPESTLQHSVELPLRTSLRGGYLRPGPRSQVSETSNLSTATTYFADRPYDQGPALQRAGIHLNHIEHTIPFNSETSRDDIGFPQPADTYFNRDVTYEDWTTFANFLFPPDSHLSSEKSEKGEWRHDEKRRSSSEENTRERRQRIEAIIAEWNQGFFLPRNIHVLAQFIPTLYPTRSGSSSAPQRIPHEAPIPSEPCDGTDATGQPLYYPPYNGPCAGVPRRRSASINSTSTSTSFSSNSSVSSITSKDLEGCTPSGLRSSLESFRADPTKTDHLRSAINQLRQTCLAQSHSISPAERKELKKQTKSEIKAAKKEIKSIVKSIKYERKTQRKARRAERHGRRDWKRKDRRSHCKGPQCGSQDEQPREQISSQHSGAPSPNHRTQERAVCTRTAGRGPWGRGGARDAFFAAQAHTRALARESEEAPHEIEARAQTEANAEGATPATTAGGKRWGDFGRERARAAECQARDIVRDVQARDYGSEGRARAREAESRGCVGAADASRRDWGAFGREWAKEAETRAWRAAYGPR
ncbi:MAG: hypothetical protein Q9217_000365 [Psora testacea]